MSAIKYPVIKSSKQYDKYCERLAELDTNRKLSKEEKEEFELLELLIETWEEKFYKKYKMEPIKLLKSFMDNFDLSNNDLAVILGIGKSAVSQILSYKKGLSKEVIRKLADHFKVSQDAFNQGYTLRVSENKGHETEKMMNTRKKMVAA